MDVRWNELREEAKILQKDLGDTGYMHHSIIKDKQLVYTIKQQGIPADHREWVWPLLLHSQILLLQRQSTSEISYMQLSDDTNEIFGSPFPSDSLTRQSLTNDNNLEMNDKNVKYDVNIYDVVKNDIEQSKTIAMDQFPHLTVFQERKIKRILLAYTKCKEHFCYSHGMVEICAIISTFLHEEDAFWTFRVLTEKTFPNYHEESVMAFQIDCLTLQNLLIQSEPALMHHFNSIGVSVQLLCTKWFFSYFAESLPLDVVARLYDIAIIDVFSQQMGSKIIFSASMAVILYHSNLLMDVMDAQVLIQLICDFCTHVLCDYSVAESFVDLVLFLHEVLNDREISQMREKYRLELEEEQLERKNKNDKLLQHNQDTRKINTKGNDEKNINFEEKLRRFSSSDQQTKLTTESNENTSPEGNLTRLDMLIHWRLSDSPNFYKTMEKRKSDLLDNETICNAEADVELATTPNEKRIIEQMDKGFEKIKRRRSRTSSSFSQSYTQNGADSRTSPLERLQFPILAQRSSSLCSDNSNSSLTIDTESGRRSTCPPDLTNSLRHQRDEANQWLTLRKRALVKSGDKQHQWIEENVLQLSQQGVPDTHRFWVWPLLLAYTTTGTTSYAANEILSNLDINQLDKEVLKSIENDISRTKNLKNSSQQPAMKRILVAFAIQNRRVGYCQGMNEILGVLLQYLSETQSLQALILLIEHVLPSYHVDSMIGLHTDCAVMNTLLQQNDKELHEHICGMGLNMEILCTKWLVTCFLTSLPLYCGAQVLDMLLARAKEQQKASRVLLGFGISIFFLLREDLMQAKDAGEVLLTINAYFTQSMEKSTDELDSFLRFCYNVITQLKPDAIEEYREIYKDEVMERFAAYEARKIELRRQLEKKSSSSKFDSSNRSTRTYSSGDTSHNKSNSIDSKHHHSYSTSLPSGIASVNEKGNKTSRFTRSMGRLGVSIDKDPENIPASSGFGSNSISGYQMLDINDANRSYSDHLRKMEEQLEDLSGLYNRGKIDDNEYECIKSQIVRKSCKSMNSPQSAMARVQHVKERYFSNSNTSIRQPNPLSHAKHLGLKMKKQINSSVQSASESASGVNSLYGRMKKVKKTAIAIFKNNF